MLRIAYLMRLCFQSALLRSHNLLHGRKVIKNQWVFDIKSDGCKLARLVARGFSQVEGLDYEILFRCNIDTKRAGAH